MFHGTRVSKYPGINIPSVNYSYKLYSDLHIHNMQCHSVTAGFGNTVCPRPPLTLTFDRLTLKLVCELHLSWGTFLPNLGMLGLWVLELFAMYVTDRQTDGQKQRLLPPSVQSGHNNGHVFVRQQCFSLLQTGVLVFFNCVWCGVRKVKFSWAHSTAILRVPSVPK